MINVGLAWAGNLAGRHDPIFLIQKVLKVFRGASASSCQVRTLQLVLTSANYYAVPENLTSLGVFRDRVLALWWRTIRRRSQKHRINWTRTLVLAQRWLPQPRALHPFPDARFAATHPR
jgi:hypothetical protein